MIQDEWFGGWTRLLGRRMEAHEMENRIVQVGIGGAILFAFRWLALCRSLDLDILLESD